jgi:hypothetical protein
VTAPTDPITAAAAFREEAGWHELELQAVEFVDRLVEDAISAGDRAARLRGIQPLKDFLGAPDSLDDALVALCYGAGLKDRQCGADAVLAWITSQQQVAA